MSEREEQFTALYRAHRFDAQCTWYDGRIREFERAHDQVITVSAVALFGASAAGIAASADLAGGRIVWAVIAAVTSGLATLVAAYSQLVAYEQHLKVYRDARAALSAVRADAPWIGTVIEPADAAAFVERVEEVLQNEVGQWGQLSESQPPGAENEPGTTPRPEER